MKLIAGIANAAARVIGARTVSLAILDGAAQVIAREQPPRYARALMHLDRARSLNVEIGDIHDQTRQAIARFEDTGSPEDADEVKRLLALGEVKGRELRALIAGAVKCRDQAAMNQGQREKR